MMYTGTELFNMSISVIDELSETGAVSDANVMDYKNRAPALLDMWQKEIVTEAGYYKTFEKSFSRKKNLLGDLNQYGMIVENNSNVDTYSAIGANCFYLETDGDCTITFTENSVPLSGKYSFNGGAETDFTGTINITVPQGTTSFLPIKGVLTTSSQYSNIVMSITGSYYFRHNNRALCPNKYASADKVPDFKPWFKVVMPSDFKSRSQIVSEFPSWQYQEGSSSIRWEGTGELYVMFSYEGLLRIKYIPIPAKITTLDQPIEVDDITAMSGVYYMAEHFAIADQNTELAQKCKQKYAELKAEATNKGPLSPQQIVDVYNISNLK